MTSCDWSQGLQWMAKLLVPFGIMGKATDFTNVMYESSSTRTGNNKPVTLHAYLAKPSNFNASRTYPAAVMFHAWNGMSEEPVYFADLLAEQGYVVLAPDLFRNVATCETNLPWNIATSLLTPQDRMNADVDDAIAYLTTSDDVGKNVDSTRIFSGPGFCFGGSQALTLSIRRAMIGTVTLYGANIDGLQDPNSDDAVWGELGAFDAPVLGIYGADDCNPSPQEAQGFQGAMTARSIPNTVTIYDGVGHAFVNPQDHKDFISQPREAWDQIVAFMNGVIASGAKIIMSPPSSSRRAGAAATNRPSFAWIWDHTMDLFYGKGHFSHGLLRHHHRHHPKHTSSSILQTKREDKGLLR